MSFGILLTGLISLLLNIPLGVWRENVSRFSFNWFVAALASIPVILLMRQVFELSTLFVLLTIGLAVVGQLIGGRLVRKGRIVVGTWS